MTRYEELGREAGGEAGIGGRARRRVPARIDPATGRPDEESWVETDSDEAADGWDQRIWRESW
ncbi:MAG: hypothetical protein LBD97_02255 [Bifidobacteriaceae bacterium]|jgi:hypothetical protein|nr:hypothetical protein [Bifidobacteriaceae bacterium]